MLQVLRTLYQRTLFRFMEMKTEHSSENKQKTYGKFKNNNKTLKMV